MPTGYVVGTFDLFNVRDLDVICQVRETCARVVVGVLGDDEVQELYGRPPVVPLIERLEIVKHVRGVDDVVVHHAPGTVQDGNVKLFAIQQEPLPRDLEAPTWVRPRRESQCEAVRRTTSSVGEWSAA